MNETRPKNPSIPQKAFTAFYDGEYELFIVDFTGAVPFAESSCKVQDGGMFTHGICTDKHADGSYYLTFNKIAITQRHLFYDLLSSDALSEGLTERLIQAAQRLSTMFDGKPKGWTANRIQLRCEKAAQLINEHQEQMIEDLIASYNNRNSSKLKEHP